MAHSKVPRFPNGLDAEIIRFSSLQQVWRDAKNPIQREHITPYFFRNPKKFKLGLLSPNQDYSHIRLVANTASDYAFAKLIYKNLYIPGQIFNFNDVVQFLNKHNELVKINQKPNVGSSYENTC